MADLEALFKVVDELTTDEIQQLREYIDQRRVVKWWIVPPENLQKIDELFRPIQEEAAKMPEEEVNALIDEAIAEVRRERKKHQGGA